MNKKILIAFLSALSPMTPFVYGVESNVLFNNAFSKPLKKIKEENKWKKAEKGVEELTKKLGAWCLTYLSADDLLNVSSPSKKLNERLGGFVGGFDGNLKDFLDTYVTSLKASRKGENAKFPYTEEDAQRIIKRLTYAFGLFAGHRKKTVGELLDILSSRKLVATMRRPLGGKDQDPDERNNAAEEIIVEIKGFVADGHTPTIVVTVSSNNPQPPNNSQLSASFTLYLYGSGKWEADFGDDSNKKLILKTLPPVLLSLTAYLFLHTGPIQSVRKSKKISEVLTKIGGAKARNLRTHYTNYKVVTHTFGRLLGTVREGKPAIEFNFDTVTNLK